jgi:hypothetical protein
MDFLQTILDNPQVSIPFKSIDPLTHDFDSESLSDRLHSLYSVIANLDTYDEIVNVRPILQKYEIELQFIKKMNTISLSDTNAQEIYSEMISKLRERTLSNII